MDAGVNACVVTQTKVSLFLLFMWKYLNILFNFQLPFQDASKLLCENKVYTIVDYNCVFYNIATRFVVYNMTSICVNRFINVTDSSDRLSIPLCSCEVPTRNKKGIECYSHSVRNMYRLCAKDAVLDNCFIVLTISFRWYKHIKNEREERRRERRERREKEREKREGESR